MTSPITKIWLFALKPGASATSAAFLDLWTEIIAHCASYTSPSTTDDTEHHVLYQSEDDPLQLAMITGYQSLADNEEADKLYASQYMKRLFEFVTHQQLFLLYVDVKDLPLSSGVTVFKADNELATSLGGKGARDCYEPPKKEDGAVDGEAQKAWVQVVATNAANGGQCIPEHVEKWRLRRIMGK